MSKKEPTLIDGYSSVQAIKRSGKAPQAQPKLKHSATQLPHAVAPPEPATPAAPVAPKAQHTAVPMKHDLVCYECDFAFTQSGKMHYAFCPKCKRKLDIENHTISGAWTTDLRTMGTIEIMPDAILSPVTLVAQTIIVAAEASRVTLRATRRLELAAGGNINLHTATMKELHIRHGALYAFPDGVTCRIIDIAGALHANIRAEERVLIRATGYFRGELYSPRLQVQDGATIRATMFLGPNVATPARTTAPTKHAA